MAAKVARSTQGGVTAMAWTSPALATMVNNLRAVEIRQFEMGGIARALAVRGETTNWAKMEVGLLPEGARAAPATENGSKGASDGAQRPSVGSQSDLSEMSDDGGDVCTMDAKHAAALGLPEEVIIVGDASAAAGEQLRQTTMSVLTEIAARVQGMVGFHGRHALTACRRHEAGEGATLDPDRARGGDVFQKASMVQRMKTKLLHYKAKQAAKRAPMWSQEDGRSEVSQAAPGVSEILPGGEAGLADDISEVDPDLDPDCDVSPDPVASESDVKVDFGSRSGDEGGGLPGLPLGVIADARGGGAEAAITS